jgi:hypothetical protein
MILDKELILADAFSYSVWGTAGTYYGDKIIDLGKTKTQVAAAAGKPMVLVVKMKAAAATGTSLAFSLVGSTAEWTAAAGTGGTFTVIGASAAIATASLTDNTVVWVFYLPETISQRYLGLKVVSVGASAFTAGTVDAYLTDSPPLAAY